MGFSRAESGTKPADKRRGENKRKDWFSVAITAKSVFRAARRERQADVRRQKLFKEKTEAAKMVLAEKRKDRLPLIEENVLQISQFITYDALKKIYAKGNAERNDGKCSKNDNTIYNIMTRKNNADFQDLQSICCIAMLESMRKSLPENEMILSGYNAVNHAIYLEKKRIYTHVFIEDFTEKGIDLIDVNNEIDRIIYGNINKNESISKQTKKALSIMTPIQKSVVVGIVKGKSFRIIAKAQNRTVSTIHEHFDRYRKAVRTLYPDGITSATNVHYSWDGEQVDKKEKKPMSKKEYRKMINEKNRLPLPTSNTVKKKF